VTPRIRVLGLLLTAALSRIGALPEILCGCTDVLKNFA
jgi:hypothetical protein